MSDNKGKYFIIGFDREANMPQFMDERFDSMDEAEKSLEANADKWHNRYWNIQIYMMDQQRCFIQK